MRTFILKSYDALLVGSLILFCIVGFFLMDGNGLSGVLTAGIIRQLITACLCLVFIRLTLRMFDEVIGFNFKTWLHNSAPKDKALYLSARFIGVCILFGLILG